MRQNAETFRGLYWQPMWARKDVCGLFAANVGPSAANVGPRRHVLAANVGSIAACLWARGITFVGRYKYRELRTQGISERQAAKELKVPRTTLQARRLWHGPLHTCPHLPDVFQRGPGL